VRASRIVGACAAAGLACTTAEEPLSSGTADSTASRQETVALKVVETTLGDQKWILTAERAVHHEERDVTDLEGLTVTFFDEEGREASVLNAEIGEADRKRRHLVAKRNVTVRSTEGYLLETEVLEWDNERRKILSDEPVRITQGANIYTGVGLVSDPGLEQFEILRDFKGTIVEEEDGGAANGANGDRP